MSDKDDIQIHLGDPKTRSAVQEQPFPASELATYVATYGDAANAELPVYVHAVALEGIERHAASSPQNEVGGALLGGICCWQGVRYVRVDDFIAARNADEKRSSLTFTHETWSELNDEREARSPGLTVVGWYHTHPSLGVFLSDRDRFIQRNFFSHPEQVALVIDPLSNERAFFHRSGETVSKLPGFYVFGDVSKSNEIEGALVRMQARRAPPQSNDSQPCPVVSKIVFSDPCINAYYLLPRSLRRLFGIVNGETAPRISVKSLIIWALILALLYQVFVVPKPATTRNAYDASVHKKFASAFAQAGDDEEAVREYRRYLVLRQNDWAARCEMLAALKRLAASRGGEAYTALTNEVLRTREAAAQAARERRYGVAYGFYSALVFSGNCATTDISCKNVFGYLARKVSIPPSDAERREVIGTFPDAGDALKKMGSSKPREK